MYEKVIMIGFTTVMVLTIIVGIVAYRVVKLLKNK